MNRKINKIIIHCSDTHEGRDYTVTDIDTWHRWRGFASIGYHFVIYRDGSVHAGRPLEQVGAHCVGQNAHSIGICYIGGRDAHSDKPKDTRTPQQKKAMRLLVADLKRRFPKATVHGHNEFAAKACPCFNVKSSGLCDI